MVPESSCSTRAPTQPCSEPGVATIAPDGQVLRIVRMDAVASKKNIRPGQTLADAKAIAPDLIVHDDDPEADRRRLESLAGYADCFSPTVHIEGDDTLLIDVTGCDRLFGGESDLLQKAVGGFADHGFSVRAAIADTPGAAWALAHAHSEPAVIAPPGECAAYITPLPVWSLRVEQSPLAALAKVGVETIQSLLYLPRSSLAMRFSEQLLTLLDRAMGDEPEVLTPYRPPRALTSRIHLGGATDRLDRLTKAAHRGLEVFCEQLVRRVSGTCQLYVTFFCPDVETPQGRRTRTVTLEIHLSRPTRCFAHLRSLLQPAIDRLRLPGRADSVMLWTRHVERLDDWQDELFVTDARDEHLLTDLLDRLSVRLGYLAVTRPELLSEHAPERAFRYVPVTGLHHATPGKVTRNSRVRALSKSPGSVGTKSASGRATRSESSRGSKPGGSSWNTIARSSPVQHSRGLKPAARGEESSCSLGSRAWEETDGQVAAGRRPLRLSFLPVKIVATALVPDGPPISFRFQGSLHTVFDCAGPERIETGWWRGEHIRRDYYSVTTQSGRRCWIFRDRNSHEWFLHGWFD